MALLRDVSIEGKEGGGGGGSIWNNKTSVSDVAGNYREPPYEPPSPGVINDQQPPDQQPPGDQPPFVTDNSIALQDLYPSSDQVGEVERIAPTNVPTPVGAGVMGVDQEALERGQIGFGTWDNEDLRDVRAEVSDISAGRAGNLRVDEDLRRIMDKDSPLLAQARAEGMRQAARRGLQNSSMAAGQAYGQMVKAALPMAQQNAAQVLQQNIANAQMRTQAAIASAQNKARLAALEAELGVQLGMFNATQLNQAESLTQQIRAAAAQQDAAAYNSAQQQLANLIRDSQSQQASLDFTAAQQDAYAQNQRNSQIMDGIQRLNQQYMQGSQAADLATIQGQYQQLIQMNETAGNLYNNFMNSMGNIMNDPKMSSSQIASARTTLQNQLSAGLAMIAEINGMDFGEDLGGGGGTGYPGSTPYPYNPRNNIMGGGGGVQRR